MGSQEEFITVTYYKNTGPKPVMEQVDTIDTDGTVLSTVKYSDIKQETTSESPALVQQSPTSMTSSPEQAVITNFKIIVLHLMNVT